MDINQELGDLNYERNQNWMAEADENLDRPAIRRFKGDVYQGMKPWDWKNADYDFAQKHLFA